MYAFRLQAGDLTAISLLKLMEFGLHRSLAMVFIYFFKHNI